MVRPIIFVINGHPQRLRIARVGNRVAPGIEILMKTEKKNPGGDDLIYSDYRAL